MEVFEKIVETSEDAFDCATKAHFIVPAVSYGLKGYGIDMGSHEAAVRTSRMAECLVDHAASQRCQPFLVGIRVVKHPLECASDAHLPRGDTDCGVEQVQIWKHSIDTVIYDLELVKSMT